MPTLSSKTSVVSIRSEEHTSELKSPCNLVCRLLLEKKKNSALLLDEHGHVTETAGANFLLVQGGAVLSPPRSSVLGGVSLQVVQELFAELRLPFLEQ